MAPNRPPQYVRKSKRRQPLHQNVANLSMSRVEQFWLERAARSSNQGRLRMANTERFWAEYNATKGRYPRIPRSQSEPPTQRRPLPSSNRKAAKTSIAQSITHAMGAVGDQVWQTVTPLYRVAKTRMTRVVRWTRDTAQSPRVQAGATLALLVLAVYTQNGPPMAPSLRQDLDQRKSFPTYMFSDPHNILGLEPPTFGDIAPLSLVNKAWRDFNLNFHTDKWIHQGFPTKDAAGAAYAIGIAAHEALIAPYENPYCWENTTVFYNFTAPHEEYGVACFAKNRQCTTWTPWIDLVTGVPARLRGLIAPKPSVFSDVFPCTFQVTKMFRDRESSIEIPAPPPLDRIYNATSWVTLYPSVLWWKVTSKLLGADNLRLIPKDKEKERWEKAGWAVKEDWKAERGCPLTVAEKWALYNKDRVYPQSVIDRIMNQTNPGRTVETWEDE